MSTDPSDSQKKPARTRSSARAPSRDKAKASPARVGSPKTTRTSDPKPKTKPKRLCGSCQGQVSAAALYCRHCGKALSAEVPANPFLPQPPKPWRPSRIPKQTVRAPLATHAGPGLSLIRPSGDELAPGQAWPSASPQPALSVAPVTAMNPLPAPRPSAVMAPSKRPVPVVPTGPRVWDPVPEVEQRMAELRTLHDRLRPQLARADLFKRRLRQP